MKVSVFERNVKRNVKNLSKLQLYVYTEWMKLSKFSNSVE